MLGLLTAVVFLVVEHRLYVCGLQQLLSTGLVACGIFPEQGLNPGPLPWQAESLPLDYQGSLRVASLKEAPFYSHGVPCLGPMPTEYSHFNGILKTSLRLLNAE